MRARLAMFEEDESSALSQKTNIIGLLLLELFLKILCDARSHVGQLTLYGLFGISHKPHRKKFLSFPTSLYIIEHSVHSLLSHSIGVH